MIVRWYMALSEFSFNLSFIRGVDNNIADAMSRLCRNNMIDSSPKILSVISRSFKPSDILYSKIGKLHNSRVGHFGVERILKRFQAQNDTWKYQRQHVKWFIDHCPCCQKNECIEDPHSCSWLYNVDIFTYGLFEYRLYWSFSRQRVYPCRSLHIHTLGGALCDN